MNKKRLLKLADLLEADAKNKKGIKFSLSDWGDSWGGNNTHVNHSCGTTACAVGLAVVSGAFKRAGLSNFLGRKSTRIIPAFAGYSHWTAVDMFFEIRGEQSHFLFAEARYPSDKISGAIGERYVAKRIRDFVAGKVAP